MWKSVHASLFELTFVVVTKCMLFSSPSSPDGYLYEKQAILEYILHRKTETAKKMKVWIPLLFTCICSYLADRMQTQCICYGTVNVQHDHANISMISGDRKWSLLIPQCWGEVCFCCPSCSGIWEAEEGPAQWKPPGGHLRAERTSGQLQEEWGQHCVQAHQPLHLRWRAALLTGCYIYI